VLRVRAVKLSAGLAVMIVLWHGSADAAEHSRVRLAQSSVTTTCMMACNSQAASCQANCVVPSTATSGGTTNATASVPCLSSCTSQQLSCQTNCARTSPSQ